MFGLKSYNYERFSKDVLTKDVLLDRFGGPRPGDRAPEFEGRTLDGEEVSLSDFRGESNVVLTFGSATCPFTTASIEGMNELYEEYGGDGVEFLFCYVREAHPGERLVAHETVEDKEYAAQIFRREENVELPIIVDTVKGSIHKKYGKLPNATYLIDKSGRVAFRSLWTRPNVIEQALDELLDRQRERGVDHAIVNGGEDRSMPAAAALVHTHRALRRGGEEAIRDFESEMGVPGRVAVKASKLVRPVAENPGKTALLAGVTAGVVIGSILLGRYLRERRFQKRMPYNIEALGAARRTTHTDHGDYEAVGI
jgi:alkyl hydroperoxide reductase subunit AhpC